MLDEHFQIERELGEALRSLQLMCDRLGIEVGEIAAINSVPDTEREGSSEG